MGKGYSLSEVRVTAIGKGAVTLVTEEELSMRGTAVELLRRPQQYSATPSKQHASKKQLRIRILRIGNLYLQIVSADFELS